MDADRFLNYINLNETVYIISSFFHSLKGIYVPISKEIFGFIDKKLLTSVNYVG